MHDMKEVSVGRLTAILARVLPVLRNAGLTDVAIGGSSAPALLDHLFAGRALQMRDFDLMVVAGRPVEAELLRRIGEALDTPDFHFLPRYVYPRRRARGGPELWTVGWGAIWDALGVEVDVSVFHDEAALELNGLMNVDRIRIPVGEAPGLVDIVAGLLHCGSGAAALAAGLVIDRSDGYAGWTSAAPSLVATHAVSASPIECAIRVVRTCAAKLGLEHLDERLASPLRAAIRDGHQRGDRFLRVRNVVKLLHDAQAGVELEMLHELGAFDRWLPEIGDLVDRLGPGSLSRLFAEADRGERWTPAHGAAFAEAGEQGGDAVSRLRLEALLLEMTPAARESLLDEVAVAEPTFAALVRAKLPVARAPFPAAAPAPLRPDDLTWR
jgi:CubicO group peptidase (beta-lactamase class C family)